LIRVLQAIPAAELDVIALGTYCIFSHLIFHLSKIVYIVVTFVVRKSKTNRMSAFFLMSLYNNTKPWRPVN